jgi:predicted dehydrogenase
MKRMAPGNTNTWYLEVSGTEESMRFSTREPRTVYHLKTTGRTQGWTRIDMGAEYAFPTITGPIFEPGFSDIFQQMLAAFLWEFDTDKPADFFGTALPEEAAVSHRIFTAALESHRTGRKVQL